MNSPPSERWLALLAGASPDDLAALDEEIAQLDDRLQRLSHLRGLMHHAVGERLVEAPRPAPVPAPALERNGAAPIPAGARRSPTTPIALRPRIVELLASEGPLGPKQIQARLACGQGTVYKALEGPEFIREGTGKYSVTNEARMLASIHPHHNGTAPAAPQEEEA